MRPCLARKAICRAMRRLSTRRRTPPAAAQHPPSSRRPSSSDDVSAQDAHKQGLANDLRRSPGPLAVGPARTMCREYHYVYLLTPAPVPMLKPRQERTTPRGTPPTSAPGARTQHLQTTRHWAAPLSWKKGASCAFWSSTTFTSSTSATPTRDAARAGTMAASRAAS